MSERGTRYGEGDAMTAEQGRGVVVAVLTDDFEFLQGDDELTDEFGEEHCSAMKDEVLRTQRWRNRF